MVPHVIGTCAFLQVGIPGFMAQIPHSGHASIVEVWGFSDWSAENARNHQGTKAPRDEEGALAFVFYVAGLRFWCCCWDYPSWENGLGLAA
jgi:hypothetical protein